MKAHKLCLRLVVVAAFYFTYVIIAQAQLIDKIISLPGPNSGILDMSNCDFNSSQESYYICGLKGKAIIEMDAETNTTISRININFHADNLIVNPMENKLYASKYEGDSIVVIDCATKSIIKYIKMPDISYTTSFLYNPISNKVYCGRYGVQVIDSETDIIIKDLTSENGVRAMTFNSIDNKVYVSQDWNEMNVIDGDSDEIIKTFETPNWYSSLCYNPNNNKVYCTGDGNSLFIIDGSVDTVLLNHYNHTTFRRLTYNPQSNKVYAGYSYSDGGVIIVDGETNEIKDIPLDDGVSYLQFNPENNTVYACPLSEKYIYVLDGDSDDVINLITLDNYFHTSIYNPVSSTMVLLDGNNNSIFVLDAINHTVIKGVPIGLHGIKMSYNSSEDFLYVTGDKSLVIVDAKNNIGVDHLYLEDRASDMLYVEEFNRLYIVHPYINIISVVDCNSHEILTTIYLEYPCTGLSYCSSNKTVYCSVEYTTDLHIIDCSTNVIAQTLSLSYEPSKSFYHKDNDQLYLSTENGRFLVLNCSDNSLETEFDTIPSMTFYEYSESTNKLYFASERGYWLCVIDCNDNSYERVDYNFNGIISDICYNSTNEKIYVGVRDSCEISIMDCNTNTFIENIKIENQNPRCLSYQPEKNLILVASKDVDYDPDLNWINAIDGESNEIVETSKGEFLPTDILYDPKLKKSYVSYGWYSGVHVINDTTILSTPEYNYTAVNGFEMKVFPNPVESNTRLNYTVKSSGTLDISILDQNGRKVYYISDEYHNIGTYDKLLDLNFLPSGIYLLRICSNKQSETQQIIITSR
jgi:DNA-binding beta-propeller fold protein YncE